MIPTLKHEIDADSGYGSTLVAQGRTDDLVFMRNTLNIWSHVPDNCILLRIEGSNSNYYVANEFIDWNEARRVEKLNLQTRRLPQHIYKPYTDTTNQRQTTRLSDL